MYIFYCWCWYQCWCCITVHAGDCVDAGVGADVAANVGTSVGTGIGAGVAAAVVGVLSSELGPHTCFISIEYSCFYGTSGLHVIHLMHPIAWLSLIHICNNHGTTH